MALTLTANIDDDQSTFLVTGTVPDAIAKGYLFRVGDEILRLRGFEGVLPPFPYPVNRNHWRAERGHGGSVAASHTAGASILGARDAWTSGDDEGQPDPFDEVLESLPIATSDVTGLDTALATIPADASELSVSPAVAGESDVQGALEALAPTAINLTDTDATTAQVSDVLNTKGGKSLALLTELLSGGTDSVNVLVMTRFAGLPWMALPAVETRSDTPGAIFSESTLWPNNGVDSASNPIKTTWMDIWAGLLDESVVVVQPDSNGSGAAASLASTVLTDQSYSFGATGDPPTTGSCTLTFRGDTTTAVTPSTTTEQLVALLEALASIGAGNVTVTAGSEGSDLGSGMGFTFTNDLGGQAVEAPTIGSNTLDEPVAINEDQPGGAASADPGVSFTVFGPAPIAGDWGNQFSVQLVDPGEVSQPLDITSEDGWAWIVSLATDETGTIVTTAGDLDLYVNGGFSFGPFALRTAVVQAGTLAPTGVLSLSGGDGQATGITYSVRGSI